MTHKNAIWKTEERVEQQDEELSTSRKLQKRNRWPEEQDGKLQRKVNWTTQKAGLEDTEVRLIETKHLNWNRKVRASKKLKNKTTGQKSKAKK